MRTALVTGATGGIGKFLVKALIDEGYRVIG
ncbi:MAG: NAD-dependent epimerase/dehydratase family protein, partial [Thermococcus sp.]|nr:NAD-dependent epimerase/dehydratase family protein [Thermococcus sp.]